MNFKNRESKQKLNGCYYTPAWIAGYISRWITSDRVEHILEPSCGDGVFFDAIANTGIRNIAITGCEIDEKVADIASEKLSSYGFHYRMVKGDFIEWAIKNIQSQESRTFDAVIGNPPFIRYQYLEKSMQDNAQRLFKLLNISFTKHTNAWIPFVLASIEFLKPAGKIGMIVPSELLHILYAKELRKYLLDNCSKILLIDPSEIWFEGTLQGAMILLAEKKKDPAVNTTGIAILKTQGKSFADSNPVDVFKDADYVNGNVLLNKWTYALLTKRERAAFSLLQTNASIKSFSTLANVDVGIVTGANDFFLVPDSIVDQYGLHDVAMPMFGRSEHCPGIIYDELQHEQNSDRGLPTNFLYFNQPDAGVRYSDYLEIGIEQGLHQRYKCRIRDPWYKVPSVYASPISMLKRSNGMPRLILNSLRAYTTDTAYRITPHEGIDPSSMVRCFLNSLTALCAELEGRHYGGGVLELVPSEIERILVPYTVKPFVNLQELNEYVKQHSIEEVLETQDKRIFSSIGVSNELVQILNEALLRLRKRRQRNEAAKGL